MDNQDNQLELGLPPNADANADADADAAATNADAVAEANQSFVDHPPDMFFLGSRVWRFRFFLVGYSIFGLILITCMLLYMALNTALSTYMPLLLIVCICIPILLYYTITYLSRTKRPKVTNDAIEKQLVSFMFVDDKIQQLM